MCLVMYTINVLTPGGRHQQVKVTPNTTLLQVLEEVCSKHGYNAMEYDLRHHNQILDVSSMFRFTSLPNNAQLEMTEASKLRKESSVVLGLQLETGERLTGVFTPSDTIWHVIITLKPEEKEMANLVVIYMRREIYGKDALSTTTLKSLGLTSGRAVLRLFHKSPKELQTQANVSTNLAPRVVSQKVLPEKIGNTENSKSTNLFEKNKNAQTNEKECKKENSIENTKEENNSEKSLSKSRKSENYAFKGNIFEKLLKEEKAKRAALKENSESKVEVDLKSVKNQMPSSCPNKVKVSQTEKITQKTNFDNKFKKNCEISKIEVTNRDEKNEKDEKYEKDGSSKVILLGDRNAVAYDMSSVKPVIFEEEPEDFYDLTINDAKMLLKEAKQLCADLENVPLMTAAQRELEKDKKVLSLLHQYKKTVLRIKFPDRIVLQGTFSPVETIAEVEKFVASYLENPNLKFCLYTTPPKVILKPSQRLIECDCVPSSILYFGLTENLPKSTDRYLKSDVLNKLSTPSAAALTAFQSRELERKQCSKSEEKEKRKWMREESIEEPKPSGSKQWQEASNDQFKCPKWFKPNK